MADAATPAATPAPAPSNGAEGNERPAPKPGPSVEAKPPPAKVETPAERKVRLNKAKLGMGEGEEDFNEDDVASWIRSGREARKILSKSAEREKAAADAEAKLATLLERLEKEPEKLLKER